MPEPTETAPENVTETAPAGEPTGTEGTPTEPGKPAAEPEFDGPYDEDRAKRLIANLRADLAREKAKRPASADDDLRARVEAMSAELEKSRKDAIEAAKRAAVADAQVPAHLAGYVTGSTPEEIKASAEKVAADFLAGQSPAEEDPLPGLPKPALTPGRAANDAAAPFDAAAVARAARGY
ncbi:hypothetical protein [Micromonospora sediminicola]|uniref:hypothetical protein n=1 Tax=Micromonospora sediminicola TaxID=946078 RepID=UPI0037AC2567